MGAGGDGGCLRPQYDEIWSAFLNLKSTTDEYLVQITDQTPANLRKWRNRIYSSLVSRCPKNLDRFPVVYIGLSEGLYCIAVGYKKR